MSFFSRLRIRKLYPWYLEFITPNNDKENFDPAKLDWIDYECSENQNPKFWICCSAPKKEPVIHFISA